MKIIHLPRPELFKEMVIAFLFLMIGIVSTHWHDRQEIFRLTDEINSNKASSQNCKARLIEADNQVNSCNKAHYALGYCTSTLSICEEDKEMIVEEAKKLYHALEEVKSQNKE